MSYRELAVSLVAYVKKMGYTHIELLPILEHPFTGSWGYQVIGHYSPNFQVWPARGLHVPGRLLPSGRHRRHHGLGARALSQRRPRTGLFRRYQRLYEHEDPRKGEHREWGTLIFNFGQKRNPKFPYFECPVLVEEVPHRRIESGRCGLDAVPGLLTQGR